VLLWNIYIQKFEYVFALLVCWGDSLITTHDFWCFNFISFSFIVDLYSTVSGLHVENLLFELRLAVGNSSLKCHASSFGVYFTEYFVLRDYKHFVLSVLLHLILRNSQIHARVRAPAPSHTHTNAQGLYLWHWPTSNSNFLFQTPDFSKEKKQIKRHLLSLRSVLWILEAEFTSGF
jgi:hypothetical protein